MFSTNVIKRLTEGWGSGDLGAAELWGPDIKDSVSFGAGKKRAPWLQLAGIERCEKQLCAEQLWAKQLRCKPSETCLTQ